MSARDGLWIPDEPEWLREAAADVTLFLISLRDEETMTSTNMVHTPNAVTQAPVVQWDQELRGAKYLVASGLCPTGIKSPEAALFIILAGRDLGLSPVASLRNIHIIQGKVELSADMQLSLFASRGGKFKWLVVSDTEATIELHAPWLLAPHVSKWTMADAQRAKLSGDNWQKYPKAMLRSRAITAGLKDIGFDATAGVYAPGEIDGAEETTVTEDAEVVSVTAAGEAETGEAPTEEQTALLERVLSRPVWTDAERATFRQTAASATKQQLATLLIELMELGKHRKDLAEDKRIASQELALR
jgi:hypothetical protein